MENSSVINRAIEMLPLLTNYISAVAKKPPASKCFKQVSEALKDNMLAAKLGFLQSVAMQLEPFLTQYQTNVPMLPFLYNDLYTLLRNLMLRFIKTDIMVTVTNAAKLVEVDVSKKANHKTLSSIDIGFAASAVCKNAQGVEVLQFKEECRDFLQHMCAKLAVMPIAIQVSQGCNMFRPRSHA